MRIYTLKLDPRQIDILYWEQRLSLKEIAGLVHASIATVRNTLVNHGKGTRPRSEATRIALAKRPKPDRRGSKSSGWKGGRRKRRGGYIEIYKPDHPRATARKGVLEHILIWEQAHNTQLPKGWVVHHLNGRRDDNRKENLIALPLKKHHYALLLQGLQKRIRELEAQLKQMRLL